MKEMLQCQCKWRPMNEDKINFIQKNIDQTVAAVNAYLDGIYDSIKICDENNIVDNFKTEQVKSAHSLENIRQKLTHKDFNLSTFEIYKIGLAFHYMEICMKNQAKRFLNVSEFSKEAFKTLCGEEIQNFDFSNEE